MPGAQVDIIARCGHLPQVERPEEFCDIVMRPAGEG
jgi:pimeloyl-ACP methyl ester carboxylesterase